MFKNVIHFKHRFILTWNKLSSIARVVGVSTMDLEKKLDKLFTFYFIF